MRTDLTELAHSIEEQRKPGPFSGVVYLTKGDEVLFEEARGMAIRPEAIPNRVDTRFQMASGCKVFTGVAVCQLIERGHLGFDTLLSDCVDVKCPGFSPDITIGHLLTHTSGITSYFEEDVNPNYEALWKELPVYSVRGPRDFLPIFQAKPMRFKPGERFEYNDGGFILLGLAVECVTGEKFQTYVRNRVFEPAGMKDSGYFSADQLPERTAYAYIKNPDGTWRTNFFAVPIVGGPDGGAYATAPDMARFWRALREGRLLGAEMTRMLVEPQVATSLEPPYSHYGYGVWVDRAFEGTRKFFVEGFDPGVAMRSAVYPAEDLIITMMANTQAALWPLYAKIQKMLEL
jgi:CubicO group peptidase (beta-lactamase class C family)